MLITFTGGRCSGVMIGPNTVSTAGHCVHTGGPGGALRPVASYRIYPGRDGAVSPYGFCTARTLYTVLGWTLASDEEYDYGAIKLNCTIGNTVGWFGMTTADSDVLPDGRRRLPGRQAPDAVAEQRSRSRPVDAAGVLPERHVRRP